MKSVIARMDDGLHQALKVRARSEGRSVNSLRPLYFPGATF